MKWYVVQRNWNKKDLVAKTLTTDYDKAIELLNQYKTQTAIQNAAKQGIERNVDIKFYKDSISAQIITLTRNDIGLMPVEQFQLLRTE